MILRTKNAEGPARPPKSRQMGGAVRPASFRRFGAQIMKLNVFVMSRQSHRLATKFGVGVAETCRRMRPDALSK